MIDIVKDKNWQEWKSFPDPRKGQYLFAPFGYGVYQVFNKKTNEYILFGRGKNVAYRITTIFPKPFGQGTRNNNKKRDYVLEHICNIQYRTISLNDECECKEFEKKLKALNIHKFNET